jgi:hypothetical protein
MALDLGFFNQVLKASSAEAWSLIFNRAWELCSVPLSTGSPATEISLRDHAVADIDLFLATSGWELWKSYEQVVPLTSKRLVDWWQAQCGGKAVLILDALSLRECPWLLSQAEARGFAIHAAGVTAAELPADTTPFAKALGFAQRSALANNGAGNAHLLPTARTESTDISWRDCANLIGSEPSWVFWHHWPDNRLHEHNVPGRGLPSLAKEAETHLTNDDFWYFAERLATGRHVVITADHGYAASGNFPDSNKKQTEYLRETFKSGRWNDSAKQPGSWVPPLDLLLETRHGQHLFVNGRRKWKSAGGYPTLAHGGLSVLEVAVPWIELSFATQKGT